MQRRYNRGYFVLVMVVFFGLTTLVVGVDAQAQIAFVSGKNKETDIYVMDTDGGNHRRLTNSPRDEWSPVWSPDSKRIAFSSKRGPDWNTRNGDWDIYVIAADGRNIQNLTNNPLAHDTQPAWYSPAFAVAPVGKQFTMWGWLKQVVR